MRTWGSGRGWIQTHGRNLGMMLALGLALLILAVFSPKYMSLDNFIVVAMQMAFIGIAALGTTPLVISGNIDLSIGSQFALTAVCSSLLARWVPPIVAVAGGIALGGVIGWLHGAMVWRIRLSPILITLGSMAVLRGIVLLLTGGYSVREVPAAFSALGQARPLGVPMPVAAMLAMAITVHVLLSRTTVGRHVYAIGGNLEACRASGIPVRRFVLATFAGNGLIVGLAGVLAASRFGSASPAFGVAMELDVITAVILGGVAFSGGEGNVLGVMLAVALLGVINSGIVSLGLDPHYAEVVKGAGLIIAVALDQFSQEARIRYRRFLAMKER